MESCDGTNAGVFSRAGRHVLLVVMCLTLALVAVIGGCKKKAPPTEPPAVNVKVQTVLALPEMEDAFDLPGMVEPDRVVKVSAEVPGRIERIDAAEGKPIAQGAKLLSLNTDLLQAGYDRAKANWEFDDRELARVNELAAKGMATNNEVDQTRTKAAASKAAFAEAQAMLDRSTILAPIGGILNQLPVEVGEYVQPGKLVAEIVDIEKVKVCVDIPERDAHRIKLKDREKILAGPNGQVAAEGELTFISELADNRTRTTHVEITVDNKDRRLRSGQIVTARISRGTLKDVIMIPLLAVIPLENGKEVYIALDNKAVARKVALGFFRGSDVQVLAEGSDLKNGDKLIVAGHRFVAPGQAVRVEEGGPDENPSALTTARNPQ